MKQSVFLLLLLAAVFAPLNAQWSYSPDTNTPVSTATEYQGGVASVPDGAGGMIMTWQDLRTGNNDIYAQRISALGVAQWAIDGVAICTATGDQGLPKIISDNAGGAIVTWYDTRTGDYDIYAQRINTSGAAQWTANGVALCIATGYQSFPSVVSDGAGGAIVTWEDGRLTFNADIYAQRISASGAVQWTADGVALCTAAQNQTAPALASDGAGGAIVTWSDSRNFTNMNYAQRVGASGVVQWTANGVAVCGISSIEGYPAIVTDGAGGAIIAWNDGRNVFDYDIYAQRINPSGALQWTASGVRLCTATGAQFDPTIVSDGAGGAIAAWKDARYDGSGDIYAQRTNSSGVVQWTGGGVPLCTVSGQQTSAVIVSDGPGGAIVAWQDDRSGTSDIFAQRINSLGAAQWTGGGVPVGTAANAQLYPTIVSDGAGGAIIAWEDYRSTNSDIYAQNIEYHGLGGLYLPQLTSVSDVPADQGGNVTLGWNRSPADTWPNQIITYYSVWRALSASANLQGMRQIRPDEMKKDFPGGAYRTTDGPEGLTNWEWIGNLPSHYLQSYGFTAPTLADSTSPTNMHRHLFFVSAHMDNYYFWDSNPDSGYSVDNLPPGGVPFLAAQLLGGPSVRLSWPRNTSDPDVAGYVVYRSTVSGFLPSEATRLSSPQDTTLLDGGLPGAPAVYYRVTVKDIHGNESSASPQASVALTATQQFNVQSSWNLVSVPLQVTDYSKSTLFPTSISNAFAYQGSYVPQAVLSNGPGYWLKFPSAQSVSMTGFFRSRDSITVSSGWNLIGSISSTLPVSGIGSIPGGIVTSQFFGYGPGGYVAASTVEPGKGYWVKASQSGKLVLDASPAPEGRIAIVPTSELPPAPPGENGGSAIGEVPTEFGLGQNYPNPFNPTTDIRLQISDYSAEGGSASGGGFVSLRVYDLLGREVATLVDEYRAPGSYTVKFDGTNLASGVYVYRLTAGRFTDTKRMVLMR